MRLTRTEMLAEARARELVVFCDGIAEIVPGLAGRSRCVAHDLLDALAMLEAERSTRVSIQSARDELIKQRFPGAAA